MKKKATLLIMIMLLVNVSLFRSWPFFPGLGSDTGVIRTLQDPDPRGD